MRTLKNFIKFVAISIGIICLTGPLDMVKAASELRPDRPGDLTLVDSSALTTPQFVNNSDFGLPQLIGFSNVAKYLIDINGNLWTINGGTPQEVIGIDHVKSIIVVNQSTMIALKDDGTVWSWGLANLGLLGRPSGPNTDGGTNIDPDPTPIPGLSNVTKLAGSYNSVAAFALKQDGSVWSWGASSETGTDPNGATESRYISSPVQVIMSRPVIDITSENEHSMALLDDNTAEEWGILYSDENGSIGTYNPMPVIVSGINNIKSVVVDRAVSFFIKEDGTLWAKGVDYYNQMPVNTNDLPTFEGTPYTLTPLQVQNIPPLDDLDAARDTVIARSQDDYLWVWGANDQSNPGFLPTELSYSKGAGAFSVFSEGTYLYIRPQLPIDTVPPVVTGIPDRLANSYGWYNAPVTIVWTSVDPTPSSGTPTTPSPTTANIQGTNNYTSGQSCDPAGNCTTGSLALSIDTVPPTGNFSGSNLLIPPLLGGTVHGTATDNTSGIASISLMTAAGTLTSSSGGGITLSCNAGATTCTWTVDSSRLPIGSYIVTVQITDKAGNVSTITRRYTVV